MSVNPSTHCGRGREDMWTPVATALDNNWQNLADESIVLARWNQLYMVLSFTFNNGHHLLKIPIIKFTVNDSWEKVLYYIAS